MSLHALQCALAALFTDAAARRSYDDDRSVFCNAYDLDERGRTQLAALAESAIASYAATLLRKRRGEASRLLPQTRAALGERFAPIFDAWAGRTPLGDGPGRYARDAAEFCKHLQRNPETRLRGRFLKADLGRLTKLL